MADLFLANLYYQANKLSTVKKCLNEVLKYGGPFSPRDLYPVRPFDYNRSSSATLCHLLSDN